MPKRTVRLTRQEMAVMEALWELGRGAVREVQERLAGRELAYTTVQTVVNRLERKGAVRRARKIGNAYVYEPVISRDEAQRRLIDELLDLIGSPGPLVAHLVETGRLRREDLDEIEATIRRAEAAAEPEPDVTLEKKPRAGGRRVRGR